jgi:hypothetical protein
MFAKNILPALAVIGAATAATNSACSSSTATINSQADATALADCTTISGSILISSSASGEIDLNGPEQIKGDLIAENAGALTTLASTSINSIGGAFTLTNLTVLSSLSFSTLTDVGSISWSALPALPQLNFPESIGMATSVLITNTFLSTLDGINLQTVDTLDINNNNRLKTFSTQVGNITTSLTIDSNGKDLEVSFPNLIWAANMTFRNISSLSIPSLAVVNGTFGLYENYMSVISAPNLTSVGSVKNGVGGLAFVANPNIQNITLPQVATVGGAFQIANNSALSTISFPLLSEVGGAIDFSGNFSTPDLPSLEDVKGGFNVQSTNDIDCSSFQSEHSSGAIQGTFTCKTTADAKSGTGSSSSSSSSSTTSKGAAVSYGVNDAVLGLSVVGGFLRMML